MLILYTKNGCPFCHKVLSFVEDHGIEIDEREVYSSEDHMNELLEKGGKRQIPFLHDTDNETMMYESDEIIEYLQAKTGHETTDDETENMGGVCIQNN